MIQRAIVILVALCASCADPRQVSYEHAIDRELDRYVFERPIDQVWPELVAVLAEHGYAIHETVPIEGRTVISDLVPDIGGVDHGYRALVRVIRLDRARYRIRIELQYTRDGAVDIESPDVIGRPTQRMTWKLIERVEPARAAKILDRLTT